MTHLELFATITATLALIGVLAYTLAGYFG